MLIVIVLVALCVVALVAYDAGCQVADDHVRDLQDRLWAEFHRNNQPTKQPYDHQLED